MIRIINAATTQIDYVLVGHEDEIYQVEWSPNENLLASIGGDHRLRISDLNSLPDISGIPTITPRPTLPEQGISETSNPSNRDAG
jgi:WD40 repeat protein